MSERSLKVVFAIVVLLLVVAGRDVVPDGVEQRVFEYTAPGTATIITQSIPSDEPAVKILPSPPPLPPPVSTRVVSAPIYLVADLDKKESIVEHGAVKRWPLASITKLMTAAIALEEINEDEVITVSEDAWRTEGTAGNFLPGEVFGIHDLVRVLIVASSNDAGITIAEFLGPERLRALMNSKAHVLGMRETYFEEATGLSVLNQSTAKDLVLLVKYIREKYPEIFSYSQLAEVSILELRSGESRMVKNINLFAGSQDFLGGKTGYINESGGNLISLFSRSGVTLVTVVLGSDDRFLETRKLLQWFDKNILYGANSLN